jgi:hypothetical protein
VTGKAAERVSIVLGVLIAAVLAFAAGGFGTFLLGVMLTSDARCDGPCFSRWDEVIVVATVVGLLSAVVAGLVVRRILRKDFELRSLVRERERAPRRF